MKPSHQRRPQKLFFGNYYWSPRLPLFGGGHPPPQVNPSLPRGNRRGGPNFSPRLGKSIR
eukprot:scaffold16861_cov101-Isochrysis_galbana.AAC.2